MADFSKLLFNIQRKGADIASASTITVPSTADFFTVTGSTAVTAINTGDRAVGARFFLLFQSGWNIVDNSNIDSGGYEEEQLSAGSVVQFVVTGTNKVKVLSLPIAGGGGNDWIGDDILIPGYDGIAGEQIYSDSFVCFDEQGKVINADASQIETAAIGFVRKPWDVNDECVIYTISGITVSGVDEGEPIYLAANGGYTTTKPEYDDQNPDAILQQVGVGVGNDIADVHIRPPKTLKEECKDKTDTFDNEAIISIDASEFDMASIENIKKSISISNPTGDVCEGKRLLLRLSTGDSSAHTISWDSKFQAVMGNELPISIEDESFYLGFVYNEPLDKWDLIAV